MRRLSAPAKLNLGLVVGPRRADGRHEVVTVLQRITLVDRISLRPSTRLSVGGFAGDTLVRAALERIAAAAGVKPRWDARISKQVPVAAGLGGGSSDAAAALLLANSMLPRPLEPDALHELAATLGADVPFFLRPGPALATRDGTMLAALELPQDYWVVLLVPRGASKRSTADVYDAFDARDGSAGFAKRKAAFAEALARVRRQRDLELLPTNDLAWSSVADQLRALGAFRADVTGAGPAVYGLFVHRAAAEAAARELRAHGLVWVTVPAWYG